MGVGAGVLDGGGGDEVGWRAGGRRWAAGRVVSARPRPPGHPHTQTHTTLVNRRSWAGRE